MPALSALLRLLLVVALAVNGWVAPAHAMPMADMPAVHEAETDNAIPPGAMTQAAGGGCHDAGADALPAPVDAPATVTAAGDAAGDCCDADSCSDCRCAMAGGVALAAAAPRAAAMRPAGAPSAGPAASPRARLPGQPLRPPIA